jgi:hypothetical protein
MRHRIYAQASSKWRLKWGNSWSSPCPWNPRRGWHINTHCMAPTPRYLCMVYNCNTTVDVIMRIMNNNVKRQVRVLTDQKNSGTSHSARSIGLLQLWLRDRDEEMRNRAKVYDQINEIQKKEWRHLQNLDQATLVAGLAAPLGGTHLKVNSMKSREGCVWRLHLLFQRLKRTEG